MTDPLAGIIARYLLTQPEPHKHVVLNETCNCTEPTPPTKEFAHRWETDEVKETIHCKFCGYVPKNPDWHLIGGCDSCKEIEEEFRRLKEMLNDRSV